MARIVLGRHSFNDLDFVCRRRSRSFDSVRFGFFLRGNLIAFLLAAAFVVFARSRKWFSGFFRRPKLGSEFAFFVVAFAFSSFLMFYTFYVSNQVLYVGTSVWSDFGPHLAMIRSFSDGLNFPTQYPHFAEKGVRYHFLFQYLVGNLEYLGMRIDFAFNLCSLLSLTSCLTLLFSLALLASQSLWVAWVSCILFMFRSSFAFFTFLKAQTGFSNGLRALVNNAHHIGNTPNEGWGLWAQNVYANQRHFSFSLSVLLLVLIAVESKWHASVRLREAFFSKKAWLTENAARAILLGLLIGAIGFWNGAVAITCLLLLGVIFFFSTAKLELAITATISIAMILAETKFFIGATGSAVKPVLHFGFLAPDKSLLGVARYYLELMGVFPVLALVASIVFRRSMGRFALAALMPLVFATTLQLTADINMNHKFVMISTMLLGIPVAMLLRAIVSMRVRVVGYALGGVLLFLLTCTGMVDLLTLVNMNGPKHSVVFNDQNEVRLWALKATHPRDVFLTHESVLNPILLAGRPLYYGWPYFAWSAGYDTFRRKAIQGRIYASTDAEAIRVLARQEKIDYVVVTSENRESKEYVLNEATIRQAFSIVYDDVETQIYKTSP